MKNLKIWAIGNDDTAAVTPLNSAEQAESEWLLEDILTRNPGMLEDGLTLVGRQTETAGGPLDLLGVDSNGRLVVFELKRGMLSRDAIAQVIDYASYVDQMDLPSLYQHVADRSGKLGIDNIDDFEQWYGDHFPDCDSPTPARVVLVGLGVNETTERMVRYLAGHGTDISLLTFHGFKQNDEFLLARDVEVDGANVARETKRSGSRRQQFQERAKSLRVQGLVDALSDMLESRSVPFSRTYSSKRMNLNLDYSWYEPEVDAWSPDRAVTMFIELDEVGVNLGFHPVAVELATPNAFDQLEADGVTLVKAPQQAILRIGSVDYEVQFPLRSLEEWEARKEQLTELTARVCEGYDDARQKALESS